MQKGYPKGGILGAKMGQKSIQNRGVNLRAKKAPLGVVLDRFWLYFQSVLGSKILIFHVFLLVFVKICVFDKDWYPSAIWNQTRSKKGPKMASRWLPKRIKNRSKNMMFFKIDFWAVLERPSPGQPPTAERAGAVEGVGGGINPSPLGLRGGLVDLLVA